MKVHEAEYHDDEIKLPVFLNSKSIFVTCPMLMDNGMKRSSLEPRLNVVWSLEQTPKIDRSIEAAAIVLLIESDCHCLKSTDKS